MPRKILGEGGYGCVHKPSLHCDKVQAPNFDYNNYVSKLMATKYAEEELREFVTIHKYDPNDDYHLGTPILCSPQLDNMKEIKDIKKCKHIYSKLEKDPTHISLLLMKYGGPDLKNFCNDHITKFLKIKKQQKSDKFWLEAHHLIKGLKFFRDNGIVHNDLKPQNILYDMKKNKLSFIDFGLMRKKSEIINMSKKNDNPMANLHWSFPIECGFMSYIDYSKNKRSATRRQMVKKDVIDAIVAGSKNTIEIEVSKPDAFELFFTYINPLNTDMPSSFKYSFYDSAFDGLYQINTLPYDTYLDAIIDSIDIYGLGFTLQYILNCFKRHNGISEDFFVKASNLFAKMYEPDITKRYLEIDVILNEYEDILLETGLLTRMNKSFRDNNVVDTAPMPSAIMTLDKKDRAKLSDSPSLKPLSTDLERIGDMDPEPNKNTLSQIKQAVKDMKYQHNIKICPSNKELNPRTGLCVKKCSSGKTRNAQFRCVKANKTQKSRSKSKI